METQKRKDAEETKALEEMMQQVEKNLDATTVSSSLKPLSQS